MNLAYSELLGDANLINLEIEKYSKVNQGRYSNSGKRDIQKRKLFNTLLS